STQCSWTSTQPRPRWAATAATWRVWFDCTPRSRRACRSPARARRRRGTRACGSFAAVGQTGVAVVPLRPDLDPAAEVLAQPPQRLHRGRPEQQPDANEVARLI